MIGWTSGMVGSSQTSSRTLGTVRRDQWEVGGTCIGGPGDQNRVWAARVIRSSGGPAYARVDARDIGQCVDIQPDPREGAGWSGECMRVMGRREQRKAAVKRTGGKHRWSETKGEANGGKVYSIGSYCGRYMLRL